MGKGQAQIKLAVTEASGRKKKRQSLRSGRGKSAVKEEILPEHRQEYNFYLSGEANYVPMVTFRKISKAKSQSNFTIKLK